jgi:hypothetical protein
VSLHCMPNEQDSGRHSARSAFQTVPHAHVMLRRRDSMQLSNVGLAYLRAAIARVQDATRSRGEQDTEEKRTQPHCIRGELYAVGGGFRGTTREEAGATL